MKKSIRKIGLILMTILVAAFLAACSAGSTVDTTLTINDDLSGTRVMELVIDQSVFDERFNGTIEDLNDTITETCPTELVWAFDDSTGANVYTFTLTFSSTADYKTQVDAIIGEGSDVQIAIAKVDSVWASGISVEESFSSSELLLWLQNAVVDKGFVDESNASKVFSLGSNTVAFAGNEYSASNYIDCEELEYLSINSINMLTDMKAYDCYSKKIELSIPASSMNLKGSEIKAWLQERIPEGATAEWLEDGTDSIFTVSKDDMTAEELTIFLNEYFDTETCAVSQRKITDNMSPFSFNVELVETVDFANYVAGDNLYRTDVNYLIKGENGYVGGRYLSDLADYTDDDYIDDDYEGYRSGDEYYGNGLTRDYTGYFQKVYRVSDISIESKIGLFGGLSREFVFTLEGEPTKAEQDEILANIEALGVAYYEEKAAEEAYLQSLEDAMSDLETALDGETEITEETEAIEEKTIEPEWNLKIKDKVKKGNYIITITQKGNREELKESSEALFGSEGDFYRVKDFGFAKLNYTTAVYDYFSLGDFADYTTEDVSSTYVLNTGFLSKVSYTDEGDGAKLKGNKVTMEDEVIEYVNIVSYGTQFNLWALLFYLLIVLFVVSIILVLKNMGVFASLGEKSKAKKAAAAAAQMQYQQPVYQQPVQQPVYQQPMQQPVYQEPVQQPVYQEPVQQPVAEEVPVQPVAEPTPVVMAPKFCGTCGAKRDPDALVCTECGTKFNS